ncbi:MAG TPA: DEAD/DEAH box helicase, partial [Pirellulaceae bacterium]|nr:DEAD/DEAH box helicase [Pirellulaceae bacterium]
MGGTNCADFSANPQSAIRNPQFADPAAWLHAETGCDAIAAEQTCRYVAAQQAAVGMVPTGDQILFERFFDESGGMQLVIHAPLGSRINKAWGLALRKRFCRSFDFELQAAADDNGVVLSLGPQHSFPIDSLFGMLTPQNGQHLLEQAVLAVPMFQVRWRWNVTRALAVLRQQGGKRVPPFLQKFRSEDLLAAAFPETVGCLENHHGDVVVPDHPLVQQTMHDCLHEAMDLDRWLNLLEGIKSKSVQLVPIETREPS